MKHLVGIFISIIILVQIIGYSESQQFVAVPSNISRATVPKDTIQVIAKGFEFIPDTIRVDEVTLV